MYLSHFHAPQLEILEVELSKAEILMISQGGTMCIDVYIEERPFSICVKEIPVHPLINQLKWEEEDAP